MPTCGNCKAMDQTVAHVRECYTTRYTNKTTFVPAEPVAVEGAVEEAVEAAKPILPPVIDLSPLPHTNYAVPAVTDGHLMFFRITKPEKGKWAGHTFLNLLIGHPGDWREQPVNKTVKAIYGNLLLDDPIGAAKRYAEEFTCCARCNSPLSVEDSIKIGFGPDCRKKVGV